MLSGASSNRAERTVVNGSEVVRLSTIEGAEPEGFRVYLTVPSTVLGTKGRFSLGDSGEKEGNEVRDLSEMEDAELEMYELYFRGLPRSVCDRVLFAEAFE